MNLLITGGAGFLGTRLVNLVVRDDTIDDITVLDDGSFGDLDELRSLPVSIIEASILDRDALDHAVAEADVVVHLAARWADGAAVADPLAVHDVNTTGTLRLLDAAQRAHRPRIVLCTSAAPDPCRDAIDASNVAVRAAVGAARTVSGLSVAELQLPDVIGETRPWGHPRGAWVDIAIRDALVRRVVEIRMDGSRPVIGIQEAADLLHAQIRSPDSGLTCVAGHPLTELELLSHASRIIGDPVAIVMPPDVDRAPWLRPMTPPELAEELDRMIRSTLARTELLA